ncbi:DUF1145 domain-containing protein [Shewanella dokdonensis]|uniref:DUF1145 domain-containing protein n=1 Tax=Shewanella dokdonensis TaxID=712036 RepID=A0ABX8DIR0_9GAMM|nr:DUF1145 domain-containing protein [Shewanella dokdonensis]MCL1075680.1 DUF1145 domain-containing protein [Shewanella dokdonensis]QVK24673.1 DUF1145 domain-containing protein [Shewanella dokdonensis]
MKASIFMGKLVTAFAWLLMLFNLLHPFDGKIAIILNILLGVTAIMHCVQTLLFHTLFSQALPLRAKDYINAFVFGVFALLDYRQQLLQRNADEHRRR